jgi:secreted PhoX family phosphatase
MPTTRRTVLSSGAAGLAFLGYARLAGAQTAPSAETYANEVAGYGPLVPDPQGILDLPAGFAYRVVSRFGETMSDGLEVPYKADGMGCIPLGGSRVALIRNHELKPTDVNFGPGGLDRKLSSRIDKAKAYDVAADGHPLPGGTTTMIYDLAQQRLVSQHLSLTGTAVNCAGGVTPWGSWLTCEETTAKVGGGRSKDHGWVFEVPAKAKGLVPAVPLKAMGRFQHEAACVDPRTGAVYMTEDSFGTAGLFYRFLPDTRGELYRGGRLQALGFRDAPEGVSTANYGPVFWRQGDWKEAVWLDLHGVESPDDDLRLRGAKAGAATFARGEGIHFGDGEMYFTCTSGGAAKHGQIMRYVPSASEGQPAERDAPGRLQLFLESTDDKIFDYGDNLTVAPWGHLIVCEDRYSDTKRNHIRGVTPEGKVYTIARNVFRENAELAGVCFSPDGSTLFVNIYWPGITLAITGPWRGKA